MYFLRTPHWRSHVEGQQYVFGEYQAYIGWLGFLMFVLGVVFTAGETWWLLVVMIVLVTLMLGHFAPSAPWTYLHAHVPPFKSMRVPARFRLLLALPIVLFMAYAVDRGPAAVQRWLGRRSLARATRLALFGIGVFAAGDSAGLFTEILEYRFMDAPPAEVIPSTRFYYGGPNLSADIANQPRQNRAWLGCRATWGHFANAAVWVGDVPQARSVDDHAVIEVANRTQNTFTVDVDVKQPTRILLNSAYDRGWQSSVGTVVVDRELLAVDLPAGRHRVQLRYWPRRLTLGIVLSVLGLVGSLAFFARGSIREATRRAR
jgi:hypothetical protein